MKNADKRENPSSIIQSVNLTGSDTVLEDSVIGSFLINFNLYIECSEKLESQAFQKPINRLLFEELRIMVDAGRMIESIDVVQAAVRRINIELRPEQARKLDSIVKAEYQHYSSEGPVLAYVASLIGRKYDPDLDEVREKVAQLQSNLLTRRLYLLSVELQNQILTDKTKSAFDHLQKAKDVIGEIEGQATTQKADIASFQMEYLNRVIELMGKEAVNYPTGFREMDEKAPLAPEEFHVVAARPGMGKTAYMLINALSAAKSGKPVVIFSLEMTKAQLMSRFVQYLTALSARSIQKGWINQDDFSLVEKAVAALASLPITIYDDVYSIEAMNRILKSMQFYDGLIMGDYLQLAKTTKNANTEDLKVAAITMMSKRIAKHHYSCFMWLSQLSRDVEKRGGSKRPVMSDLLYSGAIERDADVVVMLYREAYYAGDDDSIDKESGELIIRKNREGSMGTVYARFVNGSWQSDYLDDLFRNDNIEKRKVTSLADTGRINAEIVGKQLDEDIPF